MISSLNDHKCNTDSVVQAKPETQTMSIVLSDTKDSKDKATLDVSHGAKGP